MATTARKGTQEPVAPKAPAGSWENPLIPHAKLQELYAAMLRYRTLEAKLAPRVRKLGKKQTTLLSGAEAAAAALLTDLRVDDTLVSPALADRYLKGVGIKALLASLPGKEIQTDPGDAATHVLPAIGDAQTELTAALGIAIAEKQRGAGNVVLAFTLDAKAALETLALAAKLELPLLLVYLQPSARAHTNSLSMAARARKIPGIPVDKNDLLAVYRVAQEGLARARANGGPTLVECIPFADTVADPVLQMERYLTGKGLFTAQWKKQILTRFQKELVLALKPTKKR